MSTPLKLGLVGAGNIARAYVEALGGSALVQFTGVADIRPDAAAGLDCPVFESSEALEAAGVCDAVLVCTPPVTHHAICMQFLQAGVPVLCEKPLALDSTSALAMVAEARSRGAMLTMASKFRYAPNGSSIPASWARSSCSRTPSPHGWT
jgi:predicted dehydrogenase